MKIDIAHVAQLANLKLTAKEEKDFEKQLPAILDYFKDLQKINTDKVEPISNITGMLNVSREDEAKPSISQEDALKNAPKIHNGFFEVDAIFQEQE